MGLKWHDAAAHHAVELIKEVCAIVWPRRRFRMVLRGEERKVTVAHAFHGMIVKIDMRHLHLFSRKRVAVHSKAMIMCGDLYAASQQVLHRMVAAAVAEF